MTGFGRSGGSGEGSKGLEMKLEVIVIPVGDVDRSKRFYNGIGWRLDADILGTDSFRVVQFTPPASACSVIFGSGVTPAAPGSAQGLHLVVSNIETAIAALVSGGIDVTGPFHDAGGVFHHGDEIGRRRGPHPERNSYGSFASFCDPDGNGWFLQEVTSRLPGRTDNPGTEFSTPYDLSEALRRAWVAHGEYQAANEGVSHEVWWDWYAQYIWNEQAVAPALR